MNNKRAWQRMLSGRRLDLLDPTPLDIEIEDIAHGLSFLARWNGQTVGEYSYSVAEHSLLVENIFSNSEKNHNPKWNLAALLHDASEYVIGDMISPVKNSIGNEYVELEKRLMNSINLRFGLPGEIPLKVSKKIKIVDKYSAFLEATQIAGFSNNEANKIFGNLNFENFPYIYIKPQPPLKVRDKFLNRFKEIINQM